MNIHESPLAATLLASKPAGDIADKLQTYAFLVGHWETDIVTHAPDGSLHRAEGEIRAGWILEGRAIQDVWTIPRLKNRRAGAPQMPVSGNWYGTTLRVYDPAMDAWHIHWFDPATNFVSQQIGRPQGKDIVQEGRAPNGLRSRWRFTRITAETFHWLGEVSGDEGASWTLLVEVLAHRVG